MLPPNTPEPTFPHLNQTGSSFESSDSSSSSDSTSVEKPVNAPGILKRKAPSTAILPSKRQKLSTSTPVAPATPTPGQMPGMVPDMQTMFAMMQQVY